MKEQNRQPLLLERAARYLLARAREDRFPLLCAVFSGLLAYCFAFTNKLINHDEAGQLFGKGATVSSGRWGLGALDSIFPNISMPWIYGVISLGLIALSVCLILRLFSVESRALQGLLAGTITVFPSLIGLFGYMFTSSSYALAFFLAVLSVWMLQKQSLTGTLCAIGCLIFSVSIYQSYISIAACLLVLVLIQKLLRGEDTSVVFKKGLLFVCFLLVSLGAYYGATQVVFSIKDISFNAYADDSIILSPHSIVQGIFLAYQHFIRCFAELEYRLIPTALSRNAHLVLLLSIAGLLLLWLYRQGRRDLPRALLLLALVALLPLAINCMYLVSAESAIHTLVLYSFVSLYILAGVLADHLIRDGAFQRAASVICQGFANLVTFSLALILVINIYVANASYLTLHLRYENAYAFCTSLITNIQVRPDFTPDTKLAIVGHWGSPEHYEWNLGFTSELTGVSGFQPDSYSMPAFLEYYLGFSIPFATEEEISEITATDAYKAMAVYPYSGSMEKFGDIVVVKLS